MNMISHILQPSTYRSDTSALILSDVVDTKKMLPSHWIEPSIKFLGIEFFTISISARSEDLKVNFQSLAMLVLNV